MAGVGTFPFSTSGSICQLPMRGRCTLLRVERAGVATIRKALSTAAGSSRVRTLSR